ncbi:MAG: hypothetical protein K9K86_07285 [Pseudomonadales bacterium]|nr:hypothetical protein [Pseudomonadales bacterium]
MSDHVHQAITREYEASFVSAIESNTFEPVSRTRLFHMVNLESVSFKPDLGYARSVLID